MASVAPSTSSAPGFLATAVSTVAECMRAPVVKEVAEVVFTPPMLHAIHAITALVSPGTAPTESAEATPLFERFAAASIEALYRGQCKAIRQATPLSADQLNALITEVQDPLAASAQEIGVEVSWDALDLPLPATPASGSPPVTLAQRESLKEALTAVKSLELARKILSSGPITNPTAEAAKKAVIWRLTNRFQVIQAGENLAFTTGVDESCRATRNSKAYTAERAVRDSLAPHVAADADISIIKRTYERTAKLLEGVAVYNYIKERWVGKSDLYPLPEFDKMIEKIGIDDPTTRTDPLLLAKALRKETIEAVANCRHLWWPYKVFLEGFTWVAFWAGGKLFGHAFRHVFVEVKRVLDLKPQDRVSLRPLDLLGVACAAVRKGSVVYAQKSGTMFVSENKAQGVVAYLNSKDCLGTHDSLADFQKDALLHGVRAVLPKLSWTEHLAGVERRIADKVASFSSTHRRLGVLVSILTTPLLIVLWVGDKIIRPIQWILNKLLAAILLGMVKGANVSLLFEKIHNSFTTTPESGSPITNALADLLVQLKDTLTPSQSPDGRAPTARERSPLPRVRDIPKPVRDAAERSLRELLLTLDMQRLTDRAAILAADRGESASIADHFLKEILKHLPIPGNPTTRNEIITGCAKDLWAQLYYLLSTERTFALRTARLGLEALNSALDPSSASQTTVRPDTEGLVRQVVSAAVHIWCKAAERKRSMAPVEDHIAWMKSTDPIPSEKPRPGQTPPPPAGVIGILNSWKARIADLRSPPRTSGSTRSSKKVFASVKLIGEQMLKLFGDLANTLSTLPRTIPIATVASYTDILSPFRTALEDLSKSYILLLDSAAVACEAPDVRVRVLEDLRPGAGASDDTRSIPIRLEAIRACLSDLKRTPHGDRTLIKLSSLHRLLSSSVSQFSVLLAPKNPRSVHVDLNTLTRTILSFLTCTLTDALACITSYQSALTAYHTITALSPTKSQPFTPELQKAVNALFEATGDSDSAHRMDIIIQVNAMSEMADDGACNASFNLMKDRLEKHMKKQTEVFDRVLTNLDEKTLGQVALCEELHMRRSAPHLRLTTSTAELTTIDPVLLKEMEDKIQKLSDLALSVQAPYPAYIDPSKIALVGSVPTHVIDSYAQDLVANIQSLFASHGMPEALTTVFSRLLLPPSPAR